MSSQAMQGRRGRNRGGRSNSYNNRHRQNNGDQGRGSNAPRSKDDEANTLLNKLQREYNPPFVLGAKWSAKEHYRVKIPHPYMAGEKETGNFPVFESGNSLSDRALFYGEVLDLHKMSVSMGIMEVFSTIRLDVASKEMLSMNERTS